MHTRSVISLLGASWLLVGKILGGILEYLPVNLHAAKCDFLEMHQNINHIDSELSDEDKPVISSEYKLL